MISNAITFSISLEPSESRFIEERSVTGVSNSGLSERYIGSAPSVSKTDSAINCNHHHPDINDMSLVSD